jgi:tetratricopeptide (TPR) repeat protein
MAAALLVAAVAAVYLPVGGQDFFVFDDREYVWGNPHVLGGVTGESLRWAFTSAGYAANWHPLTWLSHMADVELFGVDPGAHHLVNRGVHALSAVLLLVLLAGLTGTLWPALLAAILFALHPLHVESVAWISERKDVLSAGLATASLILWLGHLRRPSAARYAASLAFFALALLAKPMAVSLPALLLLFDWWPLDRWRVPGRKGRGGLLAEKIPFALLAAGSGVITVVAQRAGGLLAPLRFYPPADRLANAAVSLVAYLRDAAWPARLAVFYPHPEGSIPAWQWTAALALILAAGAFVWRTRRSRPHLAFGALWYLVTLLPVLGIIQVGMQARADRYAYVTLTGLFLAVSLELAGLVRRCPRYRMAVVVAAVAAAVALGAAGKGRVLLWRDNARLLEDTIEATGENWIAEFNLGSVLSGRGDRVGAAAHYNAALRIRPESAATRVNLGNLLMDMGRDREAIRYFDEALRINPGLTEAHNSRGLAHERLGERARAEADYRRALETNPDYLIARQNLGRLLRGIPPP